MLRFTKATLACMAASGLVLAQPATAATRSANSLPSVGKVETTMGKRSSSKLRAEQAGGESLFLPLIGAIAVIIGVIIILDDDDNDSPG